MKIQASFIIKLTTKVHRFQDIKYSIFTLEIVIIGLHFFMSFALLPFIFLTVFSLPIRKKQSIKLPFEVNSLVLQPNVLINKFFYGFVTYVRINK